MNIKHLNVLVIRGLCLLVMSFLQASHATAAHPRPDQTSPLPNIIIIMTDDMGFSDIGSYEAKKGEDSFKLVLLENRKIEANVTLQEVLKDSEGTWKIVEKEVHVGDKKSSDVFKIEPNGDLTWIGTIHAEVNVGGYIHFKKLK